MTELPQGTVTFLFTDVEASTSLLQRHPRAYPQAIALHHSILREAVQSAHGAVFETIGDAVYAAFTRVEDAARAAVAAQRELADAAWQETGPLRVRMAIHVGDVELSDGHYFGPALYRCARLMALGHGGQVLLSAVAAGILADVPSGGLALRDLGEHRLKDLLRAERIFQLTGPGLDRDFPALRALDERPHNLPVARTTLVGRDTQLGELQPLLADQRNRLVTLTGPGGVGKTRLALELAARSTDAFVHGVYFVPLARVSDARLVPGAIADALSLRDAPGRSVEETLADYLREKRLLLVIDNFEHLLEAAPYVSELLATATHLQIVTTSREALRLTGEREFVVPPLEVVARDFGKPHRRSPAVELFIERARDVRPDLEVSSEVTTAIESICDRLDGLPLAIELAAARVRVLAPDELLARLERRLPLLIGGARDAPARQRTLRETIGWSHDLLDEQERALFRQFSVFNGGCALQDAEAVLAVGELQAGEVIGGLDSLVVKSLIRSDGRRFAMLGVIREFAGEKLDASGRAEAARRRHAEHYKTLVSQLDPQLRSGEQLVALARIDAEIDNIRSALAWSVAARQRDLAVNLCVSMCWYWMLRSRNTEAQRWLGLVVPNLAGARDRETALALAWAGFLAYEEGRNADAFSLGDAGLAAARRSGDPATIVCAMLLFAPNRVVETDPETVDRLMSEAIEVATIRNESFWLAWVHSFVGDVRRAEGREDDALAHFASSIEFGRDSGDRFFVAQSLMNSAHIHLKRGSVAMARDLWAEALIAFSSLENDWGVAYALIGFAGAAIAEDHAERATLLLGAVDGWFRGMGIQIQPTDRPAFDRYLGSAQARLSLTAFAAAWEEGQALSLRGAGALAIEKTNEPVEAR
ncbi:MAG: adenylate/guanylate cyclase domain-containing protein [Chloroflexota bacterium]|nr:adenylate/guanylate cyclase domain-containing protein [Chloroflexota bacterium]